MAEAEHKPKKPVPVARQTNLMVQTAGYNIEDAERFVGRVLGDEYPLEELIGTGGMSWVYRSTRRSDGLEVAVKLLALDDTIDRKERKELRHRFEREAVSIAELKHPNIITLLDSGYTDWDLPYLVLELMSGHTLADMQDEAGLFSPKRTADIAIQMAAALHQAHSFGIVHRDLKPENMFVDTWHDGRDLVKIMDFGVARIRNARIGRRITVDNVRLGTPYYMSPEHLDAAHAGPTSDLYSLGCIIFEMLTGLPPFDHEDPFEIIRMHLEDRPPPLEIPGADEATTVAWEDLVMRLLAKFPEERPQSADEVLDTLAVLGGEPLIELVEVDLKEAPPTRDYEVVQQDAGPPPLNVAEGVGRDEEDEGEETLFDEIPPMAAIVTPAEQEALEKKKRKNVVLLATIYGLILVFIIVAVWLTTQPREDPSIFDQRDDAEQSDKRPNETPP